MITEQQNLEWLAHNQNREGVSENNFRKGWTNEPDSKGKKARQVYSQLQKVSKVFYRD